ncbi:hypothetical protein Q4595_17125 [Wenyingzhuangia sp. 1_MG-2023]|jgi:hypothetical protein|nr:hypothetical protein [Wenyingzhuangia sp. 1_MG-2023]
MGKKQPMGIIERHCDTGIMGMDALELAAQTAMKITSKTQLPL